MSDSTHPLAELLERDGRFQFDAYVFIFEALRYSQEVLGMGTEVTAGKSSSGEAQSTGGDAPEAENNQRHVTGQELCTAIRLYALEQFGYMAKTVLNHWGIHKTGDFGDIVFNLIEIQQMHKTPEDRREDFEDVFDFEESLRQGFQITLPD